MAIASDAARRMENAMETLRSSFRRYIVNLSNDIIPRTRVTQETDAPNTACRLPETRVFGVVNLSESVELVAVRRCCRE